jgi:hypothetical protein
MSYRKHDEDMMNAAAASIEYTQIVPDWKLIATITVTTWRPWTDVEATSMTTAVLATCLGVTPCDATWDRVMAELPRQRLALIRSLLHQRWGILGWRNARSGDIRTVSISLPELEATALYEVLRAVPINWRVESHVRRPVRM